MSSYRSASEEAKIRLDAAMKVNQKFNSFFRYLVDEAEQNKILKEEVAFLKPLRETNFLLYKQQSEQEELVASLHSRLDKWQNYSLALGQALVDCMSQGFKPEEDSMSFLIEMGLLTKTGRVPKTRKKVIK
jgi:hypothetical protein